jgi:hypothetical protein
VHTLLRLPTGIFYAQVALIFLIGPD